MTILSSELIRLKSKTVSDADGNGGLMDNSSQILTGVVNNVWDSVFKAERDDGSVKYRKTFWKVANDDDDTLFNPQIFLDIITQGDDWITFFTGTQIDVQSEITGGEDHYGCGSLNTNVSAGAGSIVVDVENAKLATGGTDEIFRNGDTIRITNKDDPSSGTGTEELHVINGVPSVSGTEVTITLTGTLSNAYTTTDNSYGTRIMSVYEPSDILATFDSFVDTTAGDGTYDDAVYPPLLDNIGTIDQEITITFTGATTFTAVSDVAGVTLSGGNTSTNWTPSNPDVTKPYVTLDFNGFAGTWASGDTIVFNTVPANIPIWEKREVPAGSGSLTGNKNVIVLTGEAN